MERKVVVTLGSLLFTVVEEEDSVSFMGTGSMEINANFVLKGAEKRAILEKLGQAWMRMMGIEGPVEIVDGMPEEELAKKQSL